MCMCEFDFDFEKVNVNGGVVVLGYFFGMSGVWLVVVLIYEFGW